MEASQSTPLSPRQQLLQENSDGAYLMSMGDSPPAQVLRRTSSNVSSSSLAAPPLSPKQKNSLRRRTQERLKSAKLTLTIYIPTLDGLLTNFIFRRTISVDRAVALILENLLKSDLGASFEPAARYGLCASGNVREGFGSVLPPNAILGDVCEDGAILAFGPLINDLLDPFEYYSSSDFKQLEGTVFGNESGKWLQLPDDNQSIYVTIQDEAGTVSKAAKFDSHRSVSQCIDEFISKHFDQQEDPSDYAFYYVPYGMSPLFEVELNKGKSIGSYAANLILSRIILRKK